MPVTPVNIRAADGFTMVEVLVTLIIAAILMALVFPTFKGTKSAGHGQRIASISSSYASAIDLFQKDHNGRVPLSAADWGTKALDGPADGPVGSVSRVKYRRGAYPEGSSTGKFAIALPSSWGFATPPAKGIVMTYTPIGFRDYKISITNYSETDARWKSCVISTVALTPGEREC